MKIRFPKKSRVFNAAYIPYLDTKTRVEIYYGGAGSGKSVFAAQKKVIWNLGERGRKTLVVRKVGKTIRHSAFAEIVGVLNHWGLRHLYKVNKSDMEIIRTDESSQFIFAGLDDVEKLKSITGITDIWIEEATEITQEDFQQLNLRLRGGTLDKQIIMSFNPVSALSWIKKYFFDAPQDNVTILKTTYHDNRFLDEAYKREIENLKNVDPIYYQIYALGNWGVLGNLVYTNYVVEDFDINQFSDSHIYYGLDWGFNDPAALVKLAIKDDELWIIDGIYVKGMTNAELIDEADNFFGRFDPYEQKDVVDKMHIIRADSSEPARIKEWQQKGWKVLGAKKGKDSIKFGIDFLRRRKIHIHKDMQDYLNEIQGYAYREDKDGNVLEEPVDFNNHYMDATRYAVEDVAYERKMKWG